MSEAIKLTDNKYISAESIRDITIGMNQSSLNNELITGRFRAHYFNTNSSSTLTIPFHNIELYVITHYTLGNNGITGKVPNISFVRTSYSGDQYNFTNLSSTGSQISEVTVNLENATMTVTFNDVYVRGFWFTWGKN